MSSSDLDELEAGRDVSAARFGRMDNARIMAHNSSKLSSEAGDVVAGDKLASDTIMVGLDAVDMLGLDAVDNGGA